MSGQATGLPEEIKTIAINIFENKSVEPNIESSITKGVVDKFIEDGRLEVVPESQADMVITGAIETYTKEATTFDSSFEVSSYQTHTTVSFEAKDRLGLGVAYSQTVTVSGTYNVSSAYASTESSRLGGVVAIGSTVGSTIISTLLDRF